jgi:hypothetical protein
MPDAVITSLTPESMRDLMQAAGYRAEVISDRSGATIVRSATSGLPFELRFAAPLPGGTAYADMTFIAGLRIEGEVPLELVNRWNCSKRFARLCLKQGNLLLEMDSIVVGGVARDHLRAQVEIWDRLIQELLSYLRTANEEAKPKAGAPPEPAGTEPQRAARGVA